MCPRRALPESLMTLKVLYIDGVGPFGGASRSLFEAIKAFPQGAVDPYFVVQRGTATDFYAKVARGIVATRGLTRFDNTQYSHYRGVRWLVLLREFFHFPFTVASLLNAKLRWKSVDVIHVNEVTEIVPGLIAKFVFAAPLVIHVRSPQWASVNALRSRWLNARLEGAAAAVVAINENTRATLPADLEVDVVQNSFTARRSFQSDPALLRRLDMLRPSSLKVGFVGNLHHSKGLFDLLDAAKVLRKGGHDVEFVIVGGTTMIDKGLKAWILKVAGLAQDVQARLSAEVEKFELSDSFHLLGPTPDIQCVYERIDVICFPSHYDAPGRPVFEAAFSAVPSIVSVARPRADTLIDGETGLAIPARDPSRLARAISYFIDNRSEVERMGANAKRLAEANFSPEANARKLLAVYARVTASYRCN